MEADDSMTQVRTLGGPKYSPGDYVEVAAPLCWPFVAAVARVAALLLEPAGVYYRLTIGRQQLIVTVASLGFLQLALPGFENVAGPCGGGAESLLKRVGAMQQLLDDAQQVGDVQRLAHEQ